MKRVARGRVLRETDWPSRLREHRITGIRVNEARASASESTELCRSARSPARHRRLNSSAMWRFTAPPRRISSGRRLRAYGRPPGGWGTCALEAPQEAARAIRAEFAAADELLRALLLRGNGARTASGERIARRLSGAGGGRAERRLRPFGISRAARLRPAEVRMMLAQLRPERAAAASQESDPSAGPARRALLEFPAGARTERACWRARTAGACRSRLLRDYLEGLIAAAENRRAEASRREARRALADFARCLDSEEEKARRAVVPSLLELKDVLERIWPCPQLADLGKSVSGSAASGSFSGHRQSARTIDRTIGYAGPGAGRMCGGRERS